MQCAHSFALSRLLASTTYELTLSCHIRAFSDQKILKVHTADSDHSLSIPWLELNVELNVLGLGLG